jgi:hypothetical protein
MSHMFSQAAPTPQMPAIIPPPTMPDPFSPASMEAQRLAEQKANAGGRSSTILTTAATRPRQPATLAGSYAASKLGGQ